MQIRQRSSIDSVGWLLHCEPIVGVRHHQSTKVLEVQVKWWVMSRTFELSWEAVSGLRGELKEKADAYIKSAPMLAYLK